MATFDEVARAYYIAIPSGGPMQGDIWSDLPSPFQPGVNALGLLITPRCDLVHNKARFVNYLPLVPFNDYIAIEGGFELLDQELRNSHENLLTLGREFGIDKLIAAGISVGEALAVAQSNHGVEKWGTPRVQAKVAGLQEAAERKALLERTAGAVRLEPEMLKEIVQHKSLVKYKRQIARNAIADLHFLPPYPPMFVVPAIALLRCIGTCAEGLLRGALTCVNSQDWERLVGGESRAGEMALRQRPQRITRLKTPYLESLMARFGALFTRIGTRDLPDEAIMSMIDRET